MFQPPDPKNQRRARDPITGHIGVETDISLLVNGPVVALGITKGIPSRAVHGDTHDEPSELGERPVSTRRSLPFLFSSVTTSGTILRLDRMVL